MMHTNGISYEGDVLDLAVIHKIVTRSGSWFRHGDIQLGQGKEKTRAYLMETPDLTEELKQKVMQAAGFLNVLDTAAEAAEADPSLTDSADEKTSGG